MRKYSILLRFLSLVNNLQVQILILPLLVSVSVSALPIFWKFDLEFNNRISTRKMLVSPSPEIVVITIDDIDNEMYSDLVGGSAFGVDASRWRLMHADIVTKIASITKRPKSIGFDVTFHTKSTEFDYALIESIKNANKKNINIILGINDKALTETIGYILFLKRG